MPTTIQHSRSDGKSGRISGNEAHWFFQYGVWDLRIDCPKCDQWEAWYLNGYTCVSEDGVVSDPGPCRKCGFTDVLILEGCTPEVRGMAAAYEKTLIDYTQVEAYRRYKEKQVNPKPPLKTWSDLPESHNSWHINIKFQHGPIKEVGVNGCQVEDVAQVLVDRLNALQTIEPCRENALAITKIEEAIHWLHWRRSAPSRIIPTPPIASGPIDGSNIACSGGMKGKLPFPGPSAQANQISPVPFSPDITPPKP